MNRRGFLKLLGMAAVGTAMPLELDPERALWVPGAKTFFLPPPPVVIADDWVSRYNNQFITPEWIAHESLKMFKQNLELVKHFNRQYDIKFYAGEQWSMRVQLS